MDIFESKKNLVAFAGNPNVGKSTIFNRLTGLNQHTGNWAGKTVTNAKGNCEIDGETFTLVDLPGTYSLMAHSVEEEVARDFICYGGAETTVVVCDATCLERNLNLVLQTLEITQNVIVCVNLIDEAKKKKICIDFDKLSELLGTPIIATSARSGAGIEHLKRMIKKCAKNPSVSDTTQIKYSDEIEQAVEQYEKQEKLKSDNAKLARWNALRSLAQSGQEFEDEIVRTIVLRAEYIYKKCVDAPYKTYNLRDRKIDQILTSKWTGIPVMIALLGVVFWITLIGANYPSQLLSAALFWIEDRLIEFSQWAGVPKFIYEMLILGVYRVLAWVVSVMLPPMAIFFPLFTLLEDLGYLPRVAFNLDKYFKKCKACGKQALTMCMGFGCNAAGVVGCRIIDSPRERLIAIITNNFVPCNGRFPTLISIITMFFIWGAGGLSKSVLSTFVLTGVIVLGVLMTFAASRLLSSTILKGVPSSFTLELPPFRRPEFGKLIVRSMYDRTIFVLVRAVKVAAPAGLVIWLFANIMINNVSLLTYCSDFLNPFAQMFGMDGVILLAFILGFPANEIVFPIIIMAYMSNGSLIPMDNLGDLRNLLVANGWTWVTAVCTMLFSLMHWPCSTTCLTIKKETQSFKWTLVSILVPTVFGLVICFAFTTVASLLV